MDNSLPQGPGIRDQPCRGFRVRVLQELAIQVLAELRRPKAGRGLEDPPSRWQFSSPSRGLTTWRWPPRDQGGQSLLGHLGRHTPSALLYSVGSVSHLWFSVAEFDRSCEPREARVLGHVETGFLNTTT